MHSLAMIDQWKSAFGTALPAGFLFRDSHPELWLRVHSLPASKRYADTSAEHREVLHRYNSVASHLLGEGSQCTLFIARFGDSLCWDKEDNIALNGRIPNHAFGSGAGDDSIQFFSLAVTWSAGFFDDLLVQVASDEFRNILFANLARQTAFAPYDGGADLFFESPQAKQVAREMWGSWRSGRADGL